MREEFSGLRWYGVSDSLDSAHEQITNQTLNKILDGKGSSSVSMGQNVGPLFFGPSEWKGVNKAQPVVSNPNEAVYPDVISEATFNPLDDNKNRVLNFEANNPQFNLGDSTLIGKWKRRARNNKKEPEHKSGGSVLGKKKAVGGLEKIFVESKKPPSVGRDLVDKWSPLTDGFWKINTDAATCYQNQTIGLRVVIRDKAGLVKAAASLKVQAIVSPIVAEAMSVWQGIILASNCGCVPFQIDYDSLQVAEMVDKGLPSHADVGSAINLSIDFLKANPGYLYSSILVYEDDVKGPA
ncbi:hypothetical protein LWI29_016578 [Acer saccharum]|uniref:RNase H type-1 domain-containing protein n=1 Tax=Acer saccharum TaxID=4024 RepID=A0AA39T2D5_ACESA|nr:hypothetical protein LWI29_016578 [Acer saccharum]